MRPGQKGHHFQDIFKYIFMNVNENCNCCILKISLDSHWISIFHWCLCHLVSKHRYPRYLIANSTYNWMGKELLRVYCGDQRCTGLCCARRPCTSVGHSQGRALRYPLLIPLQYGPLTKYVKLRVAHAPGRPGTFSPAPTSKETTS